jgi:hypothetical protein
MPRFLAAALLATFGLLSLTGCSSSKVQGKVIQGDVSFIAVVESDDARLDGPGLSGATIRVRSDPGKLRGETLAQGVSAPDGQFTLSIGEMAALAGPVGLSVKKPGYQSATGALSVPGRDRRLLVIMKPGVDSGSDTEDPRDTIERYK